MLRETHGVAPSCLGEVADRCLREVHVMEHTLFIKHEANIIIRAKKQIKAIVIQF